MKEYNEDKKDKLHEYMKEYRKENKEKISENKKQYRVKNKEKISEHRKEKITCVCGSCYRKATKNRHEKTHKHQSYLKSIE